MPTASAPTTWRDAGPASARRTTSRSSIATRRSKSPSRAAAMNASTTSRCAARSGSGLGAEPRTRRRARLASCRAASGVRSISGAISSNGIANMSWSTNASRSGGRQRLEHHQQRQRDRVGQLGLVRRIAGGDHDRIGDARSPAAPRVASGGRAARSGSRAPRPWSATRRGSRSWPRRCGEAEPRLLDRILGVAERPEHPVRHRPQVRAVVLETRGQRLGAHHSCPATCRVATLSRFQTLMVAIASTSAASACSS